MRVRYLVQVGRHLKNRRQQTRQKITPEAGREMADTYRFVFFELLIVVRGRWHLVGRSRTQMAEELLELVRSARSVCKRGETLIFENLVENFSTQQRHVTYTETCSVYADARVVYGLKHENPNAMSNRENGTQTIFDF